MISCLRVHMPQIFVESPLYNGGSLLLVGTTVEGSKGVDVSFWVGVDSGILLWSIMNVVKIWVFLWCLSYRISYLVCCFKFVIAWGWISLQTCSPSCWLLLEYWSLVYEEQYHINRSMVVICSYMAQMGVNEHITRWNQCFKHVVRFEEVWGIGDRV